MPKVFVKRIIIVSLFLFIPLFIFTMYVDPYLLFRNPPIWKDSPALSVKQRYAKPLQAILNQPDTLLIGSSRVYRGFNPKEISLSSLGRIYNLGICSLKIREIHEILSNVLPLTQVDNIVLGLDFWMFDSVKPYANENNKNQLTTNFTPFYTFINNVLAAFLSHGAFKDSRKAVKQQEPQIECWKEDGYCVTKPRHTNEKQSMLESYQKNLAESVRFTMDELAILKRIMDLTKEQNSRLIIYTSPIHPKTWEVYKGLNLLKDYESWLGQLKNLCDEMKIPFLDLTKIYHNGNLVEEDWLDYSHFGSKIGSLIIKLLEEKGAFFKQS